ncbi:MAG: hypothetical protein RRA63_01005 [Candidatus Calescibacterium sp.]|jgi:hypothetical protein|nr:hypothetical protein [Candidatus Calescibacterium sp.]
MRWQALGEEKKKLGSILDAEQRKYYISENFKIIIMKLKDILEGYG